MNEFTYSERGFLKKLYDALYEDGYEEIAGIIDRSAVWVRPNSSIKVKLYLRNIMRDGLDYFRSYRVPITAAINAISYWQKTKGFKLEYEVCE